MNCFRIYFVFVCMGLNTVFAQKTSKPNIIWIMTEDMSPEMSCYGYPYIKTPHLDKLASEGVLFENMFATSPVCSPSRSAMITAMYQTSINAHDHRSHRDDGYILPAHVQPITGYLRKEGYFVTNGTIGASGLIKKAGKTDYNFNGFENIFDGIDYHQRDKQQPFYAQMMIFETHRGSAWKNEVPARKPNIHPDSLTLPPYYPDHPIARKDWATYLESIQFMDDYIGAILKRLDDEGLSENTVVIFSSDHGRCMIRDKQFLYDGGIKIPCIIRWPGVIKPGIRDTDMHSLIDVSAQVLKIAGVTLPTHLEGKPFIGQRVQKRDYIIAARDRMDETEDKMRAVRDKEFKYIRNYYPERPYMQANNYKETSYPVWNLLKQLKAEGKLTKAQLLFTAASKPREELYDIVKDPHELNNLAGIPKYKKQLKKMRLRLEKWIRQTGDQGLIHFPK